MHGEVRTNTSSCFLWKGSWANKTDSCVRFTLQNVTLFLFPHTLGRKWEEILAVIYLRFIPFIYQDLSYIFCYFYLPEMNYIMCISEHISHHCPKGHISFLLILSAHQHFSLCVYIYYHFQKVIVKVHFQNCKRRVPFTVQSRKTIFGRVPTHCVFCSSSALDLQIQKR